MSPRTNFQTNVQTNVTEDKCPDKCPDTTPVLSGSLFTPQIFGFYPNFPFKCWAGAAAQFSREGFTIGAQQEVGGVGKGEKGVGGGSSV